MSFCARPNRAPGSASRRSFHSLWDAFLAGRIVSPETVAEMVRPRSDVPSESLRYGLEFWLDESTDVVSLLGFDAGVGFVSVRDPGGRFTYTVLSNKGHGAWPVSQRIGELIGTMSPPPGALPITIE